VHDVTGANDIHAEALGLCSNEQTLCTLTLSLASQSLAPLLDGVFGIRCRASFVDPAGCVPKIAGHVQTVPPGLTRPWLN
jgi:hypothetical protein